MNQTSTILAALRNIDYEGLYNVELAEAIYDEGDDDFLVKIFIHEPDLEKHDVILARIQSDVDERWPDLDIWVAKVVDSETSCSDFDN